MKSHRLRTEGIAGLSGFIAACLFTGWLGSLATEASRTTWYAAIQKPPFNPPDRVFAPVWTTLYVLMAVAGWRLWNSRSPDKTRLILFFAAQLILNGLWSYLFFGLRSPLAALADIVLLEVCLFCLAVGAHRTDRIAAYLLIPYILWVSFAVYLNAAIWWLNR